MVLVPGSHPDSRPTFYLLEYSWRTEDELRVQNAYAAHRSHLDALGTGGGLWLIGTLEASDGTDVVAIFRDRTAAEEFVATDPLFTNELATSRPIREWQPLQYDA